MQEPAYAVHTAQILTLFFIMLGPLRFRESFSTATMGMDSSARYKLSVKASAIAYVALVIGGFIGAKLLSNWNIPPGALLVAGGLLFFSVTLPPLLNIPLKQKEITSSPPHPADVAIKMIITPYGIAALVVLISLSHETARMITILGCLFIIMILNALSMSFSKSKDKKTSFPMQILSSVLNTLQLALSIHIIFVGLKNWSV